MNTPDTDAHAAAIWTPVLEVDALAVTGRASCKVGGRSVALFQTDPETVLAVDNQCPHEGYPLLAGTVADEVVTCCYHNFRFDLRSGRCLKGDEAVRAYPARVRDGRVELDLTPADPSAEIERRFASLEQGVLQRRLGQIARDATRLLTLGVEPLAILKFTVVMDSRRSEWGSSHVLAVAHDLLGVLPDYPADQAVLCLMQPLELAAESLVRRPLRERAPVAEVSREDASVWAALRGRVEADDGEGAEALLRGALAAGWERATLQRWLYRLCADHFLDIGHALIYQSKVFDLLDAIGWDSASDVLGAHLFRIVNGTRHDVLPTWRWFTGRLAALDLETLHARAGATPSEPGLVAAIALGSRQEAFDAVVEALRDGVSLHGVVDALVLAASERLLRFDVAVDRDPTIQEGWLDATHALTYAHALRTAVDRFDEPAVIKLILYGVYYTNLARALDASVAEPAAPTAATDRRTMMRDILSNDGVRPIVAAHLLKTVVAAWAESDRLGDERPIRGTMRFVRDPGSQRAIARLCHEARRFVVAGKVPKTRM